MLRKYPNRAKTGRVGDSALASETPDADTDSGQSSKTTRLPVCKSCQFLPLPRLHTFGLLLRPLLVYVRCARPGPV
jgi:hypothetical protein